MNRRKSTAAALVLTIGPVMPSAAQAAAILQQATASEACAAYFGCLEYGTLTEAEARTERGPRFIEPRTASETLPQERRGAEEPANSASPIFATSRR